MTFCIGASLGARGAGPGARVGRIRVRHYRGASRGPTARAPRYSLQQRANHESGKPKLKKIVPKRCPPP
ncbi:hypothetical protein FLK63_11465 [Burkholderia gladioli]|nr:hypothetical protein [Burkholderia gladioli]